MDAQPDDSWPVSLTVERDLDGTHRAPAADDAVVVCLDGDLPDSFGATDLTLAPLCATKALGRGPNYLVCRYVNPTGQTDTGSATDSGDDRTDRLDATEPSRIGRRNDLLVGRP
ncbi:hypothetical protein [Natronomonas gomsonensis]|uniref:hypothetical protein n=1 Tax=Natronomonas gomsonensis TaxID=1046043 RepID=UPI0015B7EA1B|nr:hypothetical protein [Natronomonas gomsonensis]